MPTLAAGTAEAQTTTSSASITVAFESSLPRVDSAGKQLKKRSLQYTPEAVSYQDCVDDQRIRFTLLLGGYVANSTIEVWASNSGQDCSQATNRGTSAQQCWKIVDSAIALQPQVNVDIPVRKIMGGVTPFTPVNTNFTENVCGQVNLANISVQFLYFDPGNLSTAAVDHTTPITVDTVGPAAPTGLSHLPGNTRIQVNWTSISGGNPDAGTGGGLTELTGVKIYCDPSPTSSVTTTTEVDAGCNAADGGIDETGDAGDGGVVCTTTTVTTDGGTGSCGSNIFTLADGGTIEPNAAFNAKYECGSYTGNSGTTVVGGGLVNDKQYAVAVAATDKYGNVGPLSPTLCETPQETTDFWEEYKAAGGRAGGCATTDERFPYGTLTAAGIAAVLGTVVMRRRRNRS